MRLQISHTNHHCEADTQDLQAVLTVPFAAISKECTRKLLCLPVPEPQTVHVACQPRSQATPGRLVACSDRTVPKMNQKVFHK